MAEDQTSREYALFEWINHRAWPLAAPQLRTTNGFDPQTVDPVRAHLDGADPLVVAWVYGFMFVVGDKINVITATIAAIAVGVGVDYATHLTMRFIEEFEHEPSRFPATRRSRR